MISDRPIASQVRPQVDLKKKRCDVTQVTGEDSQTLLWHESILTKLATQKLSTNEIPNRVDRV